MKTELSIFKKLMLGLLLMFFLIFVVFLIIYQLIVADIRDELKKNKISEVKFITSQLSGQFEQVLMNTITISEEQTVRKYPYTLQFGDNYAKYEMKLSIIDKLALNASLTSWNNSITLYYPDYEETVSSDHTLSFSEYSLPTQEKNKWVLHTKNDGSSYYSNLTKSHVAPLFIETRVPLDSLHKMMQSYTSGTPVLYDSYNQKIIQPRSSLLTEEATRKIIPFIQGNSGYLTINEDGTEYLLNYMKSNMLDLYFIDYHPTNDFIATISQNNKIFFYAIMILLLISVIFSILLFKQVQTPVIKLRKAINRFDRGDYSSRVTELDVYEFRLLGNSFNRMAENIQRLIEKVLVVELEVKESRLKQYQAQINPHFLYNCLNYIQSKASIEDHESVTVMTLHLGAYSRYLHNIENYETTLNEELLFVEHYLSIIRLRRKNMSFSVDIPPEIRSYHIPRMILQPLVENCIQHGIETKVAPGHIEVTGKEEADVIYLFIKDNGIGISDDKLVQIHQHMEQFISSKQRRGTGLRNVHQRLKLYSGKDSGLTIHSELNKGTCYILTIQK